MYDCHIHSSLGNDPKAFMKNATAAGITGGSIFSPHPLHFHEEPGTDQRWENLLDYLMELTSQTPGFNPVFWIDPTDADIEKQIRAAASRGVAGFKIICNHFYPSEVLKPLRMIAETGLPVHFHSGILYSPRPAGKYNRPMEFECLLEVKGLRFALAHVSWPWTDECISIFGEFNFCPNDVEMYIDLTPGTPLIYRKQVLRTLYLTRYPKVRTSILWGSDNTVANYQPWWIKDQMAADRKIMAEIAGEVNDYRYSEDADKDFSDIFDRATGANYEEFFRKK